MTDSSQLRYDATRHSRVLADPARHLYALGARDA